MRPLRGFSLIELLVVISIVTVLISVLVPTISLSRDVAASSVCLSNQRQIGIASAAYQAEFKGVNAPTWKLHNTAIASGTLTYRRRVDPNLSASDRLFGIPSLYPGTSSAGWIWSNYLLGQLGTVNALICPSKQTAWIRQNMEAARLANPDDGQGYIPLNGSYGVNLYIYEGLTSGYWVRPEKLIHPSQTSYIFDYTAYGGGRPLNNVTNFATWPGLFTAPTTAVMHSAITGNPNYTLMATTQRHPNTTINALVHDGSAKSRSVFELYNPNLGGTNGFTVNGNTDAGNRFWGYNTEVLANIRFTAR